MQLPPALYNHKLRVWSHSGNVRIHQTTLLACSQDTYSVVNMALPTGSTETMQHNGGVSLLEVEQLDILSLWKKWILWPTVCDMHHIYNYACGGVCVCACVCECGCDEMHASVGLWLCKCPKLLWNDLLLLLLSCTQQLFLFGSCSKSEVKKDADQAEVLWKKQRNNGEKWMQRRKGRKKQKYEWWKKQNSGGVHGMVAFISCCRRFRRSSISLISADRSKSSLSSETQQNVAGQLSAMLNEVILMSNDNDELSFAWHIST